MTAFTIDVASLTFAVIALGALFGAWTRPRLYNVFATLASAFGVYASASVSGATLDTFVLTSWLLSAFFGTACVTNLIATWVRRIEMELRAIRKELETLRLVVKSS